VNDLADAFDRLRAALERVGAMSRLAFGDAQASAPRRVRREEIAKVIKALEDEPKKAPRAGWALVERDSPAGSPKIGRAAQGPRVASLSRPRARDPPSAACAQGAAGLRF
jgi:hypothetical protein